jgi:3-hydroxyacyl-[acyl-carrier-protein] dehydratase
MENAAGIIRKLPHRYPFLMVDRVVEVVPGKRAVAIKNITNNCFATGTSGLGYPRVFLLEIMAQVGALAASGAVSAPGGEDGVLEPGYLAGLHDVRFDRTPEIGDQVVFTLDFVAAMGGLARFKGTAKIGGEVAAESGLTFSAPVTL